MHCRDCGEDVLESERPASVACHDCGAVLHYECCMSDPASIQDFCEVCFFAQPKRGLSQFGYVTEAEA